MHLAGIVALMALGAALAPPKAAMGREERPVDTYRVTDVRTASDRAEVVGAGVAIDEVDHGAVVVTATPGEARRLRELDYRVEAVRVRVEPGTAPGGARANAFPPADSGYHDYDEMSAQVAAIAAAHPSTVSRFSLGHTFEGASCGPSRSATTSRPTRPNRRCYSPRASTRASTSP